MTGMTYARLIKVLAANEGVMKSASLERSYGKTTIWHGTLLKEFFKETQLTMNFELELCSSGIKPVLGGSGNLTSVTASYEERTTAPQMVPRYPGQEMPEDDRLVKASDSCFHILGLNKTYQFSGRGSPVWVEADQGDSPGPVNIESAMGPFLLAIGADAKIEQVSEASSNDGEADTWQGTVFEWAANSNTTIHLIDLPSEISAQIPAQSIYQVTDSYTMSGNLDENVKRTIALTIHPTT